LLKKTFFLTNIASLIFYKRLKRVLAYRQTALFNKIEKKLLFRTQLKMKYTKKIHFLINIAMGSIFLVSFTIFQDGGWVAPESADSIKNPLKGDEQSMAEGKKLFNQMCAVCHGYKGKGNGVAAVSLNPKPANFWQESVQKQSDGAIYWKLNKGRKSMASYSYLSDEKKWQLIDYLRTFKKPK